LSTLRRGAAAIAVLLVALVGVSVLTAGTAGASPPRYSGIYAGPGGYPKTGYYDTQAGVTATCQVQDSGGDTTYLRITWAGITGYAAETPFDGVTWSSSTPLCTPPSATCVASGFQNSIVQYHNSSGGQNTSWYVGEDCLRRWIQNIDVFWCLRFQGIPDHGEQSAATLDSLPDLNGVWAKCVA